ncbi:MAG: YiiD C-terminal domain-containing protein [Steroidobacteraceae bacterium]
MRAESPFGKEYLQKRITSEFALARHIGVVVERADDFGLVLSAPLAPNANYKGTAFGGSLFSVAVLTGWAWLTRYLDAAQVAADAVIQESTIRYLAPVHGILRATLVPPTTAHIEKFRKMLQRAGRGRIRLIVDIRQGPTLAAKFEGVFAAAER